MRGDEEESGVFGETSLVLRFKGVERVVSSEDSDALPENVNFN